MFDHSITKVLKTQVQMINPKISVCVSCEVVHTFDMFQHRKVSRNKSWGGAKIQKSYFSESPKILHQLLPFCNLTGSNEPPPVLTFWGKYDLIMLFIWTRMQVKICLIWSVCLIGRILDNVLEMHIAQRSYFVSFPLTIS